LDGSPLDIKLFVTELSDYGPKPVAVSLGEMFTDEMEQETFLLRNGAYFMSILGQSSEKFTGLFGPLPVHGFYDSLSYLFAFEVDDKLLSDERLEGKAYCILALFFKKSENEAMNFLRNYIEAALWKFVKTSKDISSIDDTFLLGIRETLQFVYNETSIERTESKVIIRKRIDNAVTKTEIRTNLNNLKDKLKWTVVTDPITGDFPVTVESILSLLADQIKKYEQKGLLQLAEGKIQASLMPATDVIKKRKELSNSDGVIFTFGATTKGIKPDNPNINFLKDVLLALKDEKTHSRIAVAVEGEIETSAPFEISVASISSTIDSQLLFAQPISFFPIHRDFPEQILRMIAFLLKKDE
jgi:hypothetical protein